MEEIKITPAEEEQRLDKFLKRYFKEASGSFLYKMLRKKNITLNGKKAGGSEHIASGDVIQVYFSEETFRKMRGEEAQRNVVTNHPGEQKGAGSNPKLSPYAIQVIYEDENFILVNKPAGILSQPDASGRPSMNEYLMEYLETSGQNVDVHRYKPSFCHRLDFNTSGLLLGAKTLKGARLASESLKDRSLLKYYVCFTQGRMEDMEHVKHRLLRQGKNQPVKVLSRDASQGQLIDTSYHVLWSNGDVSMVEVSLHTGKTHQIRSQLAHLRHPILGDLKYGDGTDAKNHFSSQALHAYRMVFPDGREFFAPYPKEMKQLMDELGIKERSR